MENYEIEVHADKTDQFGFALGQRDSGVEREQAVIGERLRPDRGQDLELPGVRDTALQQVRLIAADQFPGFLERGFGQA